jgi:hypothetical protein
MPRGVRADEASERNRQRFFVAAEEQIRLAVLATIASLARNSAGGRQF